MSKLQYTIRGGIFALLAVLAASVHGAMPQDLRYSVVYRGVFSVGQDMPIADLSLTERPMAGDPTITETRLDASSSAYPFVESLYPVRYRFRTWSEAGHRQVLGFETFEKTRRLKHRLFLRDDSALGVRRIDLAAGEGDAEIAQINAGSLPPCDGAATPLLDRLGLLQKVRQQALHNDARFEFGVTNGRERLIYRIRVETAQTLRLEGKDFEAWKLRFDGVELDDDGNEVPAHRPVYVWLSRSPGHVPLRIDSRHAIGRFRVQLKPGPEQLALFAAP